VNRIARCLTRHLPRPRAATDRPRKRPRRASARSSGTRDGRVTGCTMILQAGLPTDHARDQGHRRPEPPARVHRDRRPDAATLEHLWPTRIRTTELLAVPA
jgi:hypothetical protein